LSSIRAGTIAGLSGFNIASNVQRVRLCRLIWKLGNVQGILLGMVRVVLVSSKGRVAGSPLDHRRVPTNKTWVTEVFHDVKDLNVTPFVAAA
jgi:hypothetical protein